MMRLLNALADRFDAFFDWLAEARARHERIREWKWRRKHRVLMMPRADQRDKIEYFNRIHKR